MTAMVSRVKGGKLLVLSESDREMNISANRVLLVSNSNISPSSPRMDIIRKLQEISSRRNALCADLRLSDLWDLLEGEGSQFTYEFLAELAFDGTGAADQVAATMRAIFDDGLLFKMRPDGAERHSAEKIEQIAQTRAREEQRQKEKDEGSRWLARVWKGDMYEDPPKFSHRILGILKDMALYGNDASEYKWGQALIEEAGLGADPLKPFHLLVKMGEFSLHENLDLYRSDVETGFSADVLAEAERVSRDFSWMDEKRRDLTGLDVITADSGGARDFDDAVSLEVKGDRLVLGVHIADVSAVVRPGMLLDQEALKRATSIYMPDMRIPMLPEILSEECLSLRAGEIRPAFSMLAELTDEGEVLNYEFTPSLLKVKRQLSYQEVDATVETDRVLSRMFFLSKALKNRRVEAGALLLPMPKLNVYITPEGEIGVNLTLWENPGRSMIGEFMILANHLAARYLSDNGFPCIYRCQKAASEVLIRPDSGCEDLFMCLRQRRFLNRVTWDIEPAPHSGMGLDCYSNLTSPLRRYIDLIIQRQVRSSVNGGGPTYSKEKISQDLTTLETTLRRASQIQNRRKRYWLLRYLEGPGRKDYEALVLEKLPHRWKIFITELMLDADLQIRSGRQLEPGETIVVRIRKADAREDVLKFELV